jgi:hypothetical protein
MESRPAHQCHGGLALRHTERVTKTADGKSIKPATLNKTMAAAKTADCADQFSRIGMPVLIDSG